MSPETETDPARAERSFCPDWCIADHEELAVMAPGLNSHWRPIAEACGDFDTVGWDSIMVEHPAEAAWPVIHLNAYTARVTLSPAQARSVAAFLIRAADMMERTG